MATKFTSFPSRRSVVHSLNGIVACTQPLAAAAGQNILREGGNAADAAVAVAACLNVTEPWSTGIGGDMFCLFYDARKKSIGGLNGSGRSPQSLSLKDVRQRLGFSTHEYGSIPLTSPYAVTTPGAPAAWVDTVERFGNGKLSMKDILDPAIELADSGYPVSEIAAHYWKDYEQSLRDASPNFREMLKRDSSAPDGARAPRTGEIMTMPTLANTFRQLASRGKAGFYSGPIAEAIEEVMRDRGGYLTKGSELVQPVSLRFTSTANPPRAVDIWEHPPNGQGIVALMALGIVQELRKSGAVSRMPPHNSAEYLHLILESLRIAFADGTWWISDPEFSPTPELLSASYLSSRATLFRPEHASNCLERGSPALRSSDTVYFAVVDSEGNSASVVNSNFYGFGSAIIPANCGFVLQSRGAMFSLEASHPNALEPGKRPYHTIIPALATNPDGSLYASFGVMGGFMQPQGHVQVLLNMLEFGMSPQEALDAPRVCISGGIPEADGKVDLTVNVEEGIGAEAREGLERRGHRVRVRKGWERDIFGRGQIIRSAAHEGRCVFSAGSDFRGDGLAIPV
ncbi:hypothetical protein N7468_008951 [Penicillium chermesinum]|uniref:Gamma-glutamyltranspeptidase n=1 Tax=Penicillium chermesinum TaxID=63820 RepID=A0A9W9NGV4_9EURO|nr:uncharacterized protein N7468_008951 [Penicillium chermesinum]KAJ5219747.1 hypothetical protein N7468_008951 [Penicillium chermesinum]